MHSEFGIHSTKGAPRVEDRAGRHLTGASDRGSTGIKLSGARERTRTSRAYKQETVVPDYRRRPEALILHVRRRAVLEPIGLHSRRRLLLGTSANDFGEQTMPRYYVSVSSFSYAGQVLCKYLLHAHGGHDAHWLQGI